MTTVPTTSLTWRKSSMSGNDTSCVEVRGDLAAVRDTKHRDGPMLSISVEHLVDAVVSGKFDR